MVLDEGFVKCQSKDHTTNGAPARSNDDSKYTDGEEVKVRKQGYQQIIVPVMETNPTRRGR